MYLQMLASFVVQIALQLYERLCTHTLHRVSETPIVQKILNAGVLFREHVYTENDTMCDVNNVLQVQ